jgi:pantothenate synthetase
MRAQKELEAAAKKAAEEEARQIKALAKARAELEAATTAEREQLELRIQELEGRIAAAGDLKERAISMAQQTRIGHVYVISNVGAFGQDVFKIGMTRRLEPVERIHELGGASVPFPFDIHAMVFTQDAPSLERALHNQLDPYRINRVNNRKEFFRASLSIVKEAINVHAPDATFVNEPDAQQYFASLPSEVIQRMRAADEEEDEADMFPAELV